MCIVHNGKRKILEIQLGSSSPVCNDTDIASMVYLAIISIILCTMHVLYKLEYKYECNMYLISH